MFSCSTSLYSSPFFLAGGHQGLLSISYYVLTLWDHTRKQSLGFRLALLTKEYLWGRSKSGMFDSCVLVQGAVLLWLQTHWFSEVSVSLQDFIWAKPHIGQMWRCIWKQVGKHPVSCFILWVSICGLELVQATLTPVESLCLSYPGYWSCRKDPASMAALLWEPLQRGRRLEIFSLETLHQQGWGRWITVPICREGESKNNKMEK